MLIALVAARSGVDVLTYWETRTEGHFSLDVMAWIASWSTPAAAMLGGKGKGKSQGDDQLNLPTNAEAGVYNRIPEKYRWARPPSKGAAVRFIDIDQMDRPASVQQMEGMFAASFPLRRKPEDFATAARDRAAARKRQG